MIIISKIQFFCPRPLQSPLCWQSRNSKEKLNYRPGVEALSMLLAVRPRTKMRNNTSSDIQVWTTDCQETSLNRIARTGCHHSRRKQTGKHSKITERHTNSRKFCLLLSTHSAYSRCTLVAARIFLAHCLFWLFLLSGAYWSEKAHFQACHVSES